MMFVFAYESVTKGLEVDVQCDKSPISGIDAFHFVKPEILWMALQVGAERSEAPQSSTRPCWASKTQRQPTRNHQFKVDRWVGGSAA